MGWILVVGGKTFFTALPLDVLITIIIGGGLLHLRRDFLYEQELGLASRDVAYIRARRWHLPLCRRTPRRSSLWLTKDDIFCHLPYWK